jgi:uncharacterized damage-inducible protein DinB
MTPTHAALLPVVQNSFGMLRTALDGLPDEAAGWTPAPNTNSLTVLTLHSITSARFWLGNGSGRRASLERYRAEDRAPAFASSGKSIPGLLDAIDAFLPEIEAILSAGDEVSLTAAIEWPADEPDDQPRSGIGCLFHGVAHLREHVGQAQLMRDLWLALQS